MGEEMGLAQAAAAQGSGVPGAGQMPSVEEIAALLAQGITPEELKAAGVPMQLIEQAMAMLQGSMPQQGPQAGGLAEQAAMSGMM